MDGNSKITTMKMFASDKLKWKKQAEKLGIVRVGANEQEVFKEYLKKVNKFI